MTLERRGAALGSALAALAMWGSARAASIDPKTVDDVVRGKQEAFQTCYDEGLSRKPKLRGKVVVLFRVEKDGSVTTVEARAKGTTLKDDTVVTCLLGAFRDLHFPDMT